MNKKITTGLVLLGVCAMSVQAAEIRFRQSGNWTNTAPLNTGPGWQNLSSVPTTADRGILNWGGGTVTVTTSETIGELRVGQDEIGNLIVGSGGSLETVAGAGQNGRLTLGQGNNPLGTGSLLIQSGGTVTVNDILFNGNKANGTADIHGTLTVGSHLWTGWDGATGTYNIHDGGELNVSGQLGLNWRNNGSVGLLNVNDGGVVNLSQIHSDGNSIQGASKITLDGSGVVYKSGNFVNTIQTNYVDQGKIVGAGGETVSVTFDSLNDRTIVAIPEPATIGLVALFGGGMLFLRRRFSI